MIPDRSMIIAFLPPHKDSGFSHSFGNSILGYGSFRTAGAYDYILNYHPPMDLFPYSVCGNTLSYGFDDVIEDI